MIDNDLQIYAVISILKIAINYKEKFAMNMNFNRAELRDKIHGCWIGKNIGGTMGGPFEGTRDVLDIQGYTTAKGEPLPNDDLDLQLVWLRYLEENGPFNMTALDLGEYWISYIVPHWAEYGIGKSNLRYGIQPPLCGAINNDYWKNSNGAWIRTEIWACLNPGNPDAAIKYAFKDACIDHGIGEGTYAAVFVAALESAAFVESDIRKLIDIGLTKIPEDCRMAKAIKLLLDNYDNGVDWVTTRNDLVKQSEDIGWFQAPANVAFAILGILYGEGDFKKSMITAINCGDDTDCTAATVGSILGIINGTAGIPTDWQEYIGDKIVTVSINMGCDPRYPLTITDLTDRVLKLVPVTASTIRNYSVTVTDEPTDTETPPLYGTLEGKHLFERSEYSFDADLGYGNAVISYDRCPRIKPGESIGVNIRIVGRFWGIPENLSIRFITPEGFRVDGPRAFHMEQGSQRNDYYPTANNDYVITAGENVEAQNRIIVEVVCQGRPSVGLFEMIVLG